MHGAQHQVHLNGVVSAGGVRAAWLVSGVGVWGTLSGPMSESRVTDAPHTLSVHRLPPRAVPARPDLLCPHVAIEIQTRINYNCNSVL